MDTRSLLYVHKTFVWSPGSNVNILCTSGLINVVFPLGFFYSFLQQHKYKISN